MEIAAVGYGAGTRDNPDMPNLLRVILGQDDESGAADTVVELSANIDDCTGEILGAHLIGPDVTELIGEFSLARFLEATPEELARAVHPHPTLSEVIGEAASGREAVQMAETLHPSVIGMDIAMPELNGIDASAQITRRSPDLS